MPIYEFKCLDCGELTEIIFTSSEDSREIKCRQCGAKDMERVLSTTNYSMKGSSPSSGATASATTKTCASGQCGTIEIPGIGD